MQISSVLKIFFFFGLCPSKVKIAYIHLRLLYITYSLVITPRNFKFRILSNFMQNYQVVIMLQFLLNTYVYYMKGSSKQWEVGESCTSYYKKYKAVKGKITLWTLKFDARKLDSVSEIKNTVEHYIKNTLST